MYQKAAKSYHPLVPKERTAHLRELRAWSMLKESSVPALITTTWIRKLAELTIWLVAVYHPATVIGTVAPTQEAVTAEPHFSNIFPADML